jgi:hypothetical protein
MIRAGRAHPLSLLVILLFHQATHTLCIPKSPCRQLVQDADLCEDIEVVELVGVLVGAVGVAQGGFGDELAACVLVVVVVADACQWGYPESVAG